MFTSDISYLSHSRGNNYGFAVTLFALACSLGLATLNSWASEDWRASLPKASSNSVTEIEVVNAKLALNNQLSVQVERLSGLVLPTQPDLPASIENLSGFEVQVKSGLLRIPESSLLPMVQAELTRIRAPLRLLSAQVKKDSLWLKGELLRHGRWIPFDMQGKPILAGSTRIELTPSAMTMRKVNLVPALMAADVHFSEILNLDSPAFKFRGRVMILDLQTLLPAPKVRFELSNLELEDGFILATIGDRSTSNKLLECQNQCPESYLLTNGGQLEAMGITLANTPTLITATKPDGLSLSLSEIRPTLMSSLVRIRNGGAIWVQINPNLKPAPVEDPRLRKARQALSESGQLDSPNDLILIAKNSRLTTPAGVTVDIHDLVSTAQGAQLEALPTLAQNALMGRVALTFPNLDRLLNRVTFFYEGSPVRKVSTRQVQSGQLEISMSVKPHLGPLPLIWSPTTMQGRFSVSQDQSELLFRPDSIQVFGINVKGLLTGLGMELSDLVSINRPDVQLEGNLLRLKIGTAIPPLTLKTLIQSVTFGTGLEGESAIELAIGSAKASVRFRMNEEMKSIESGLWMDAENLQAYGMQIRNSLAHVTQSGVGPLTIDLAKYPDVLQTGHMRLTPTGLVEVTLPPVAVQSTQ